MNKEEMKKYLVKYGKSIALYIYDTICEDELENSPIPRSVRGTVKLCIKNRSFDGITPDEASKFIEEFIEPVAYGDIDLCDINVNTISVKSECKHFYSKYFHPKRCLE